MTVRELIALLGTHDPDRLVVLSRDAEGNGYEPLRIVATAAYDEAEREIGLEVLTDDDRAAGYGEEDVGRGVPAVVLWP